MQIPHIGTLQYISPSPVLHLIIQQNPYSSLYVAVSYQVCFVLYITTIKNKKPQSSTSFDIDFGHAPLCRAPHLAGVAVPGAGGAGGVAEASDDWDHRARHRPLAAARRGRGAAHDAAAREARPHVLEPRRADPRRVQGGGRAGGEGGC